MRLSSIAVFKSTPMNNDLIATFKNKQIKKRNKNPDDHMMETFRNIVENIYCLSDSRDDFRSARCTYNQSDSIIVVDYNGRRHGRKRSFAGHNKISLTRSIAIRVGHTRSAKIVHCVRIDNASMFARVFSTKTVKY